MPEFYFNLTITVPVTATADDEVAARAVVARAVNDTLFNRSEAAVDLDVDDDPVLDIELIEEE